jgi:hypothetical protein
MKILKFLRWCIINGIFAGLVWHGLINPHTDYGNMFANIALFGGWFMVVMIGWILFGYTLAKNEIAAALQKDNLVPDWLDMSYDVGITMMFAAANHYILAGFYMFFNIIVMSLKGDTDES